MKLGSLKSLNDGPCRVSGMLSGSMNPVPCRLTIATPKDADVQAGTSRTLLCMTSCREPFSTFCPQDFQLTWLANLLPDGWRRSNSTWCFRTGERDLGLVCLANHPLDSFVTYSTFPTEYAVGSIGNGTWELVPFVAPFNIGANDYRSLRMNFDGSVYRPHTYEFVGVAMKQSPPSDGGYLLYSFYRKEAQLHVWLYTSSTRSWKEVGTPCEVDRISYGWHCAGSGSSSRLKNKLYICSIQFYKSREENPVDEPVYQSPVQPRTSPWVNNNKMRMVAFNTVSNMWEEDILPKEGVVSPVDPDPNVETQVRATVLVCKEKLYVVGSGNVGQESVQVWEMKPGGSFEEVSQIQAYVGVEAIWFGTDGVGKIFVTVCEEKFSLEPSRVMEFDIEKQEWKCIPVPLQNTQTSHFMQGVVVL